MKRGDTVYYTGWLPPEVFSFSGRIVSLSGQSALVQTNEAGKNSESAGCRVWVDRRNLSPVGCHFTCAQCGEAGPHVKLRRIDCGNGIYTEHLCDICLASECEEQAGHEWTKGDCDRVLGDVLQEVWQHLTQTAANVDTAATSPDTAGDGPNNGAAN